MSNDININESAILETLNHKIDYDGGNYKGSGLANYVVDKTGDTMTGSLISEQSSFYQFVAKSTVIDATATPTSTQHVGIDFKDKNNVRLGWFGVAHDKSGATYFNLMNFNGASDGFMFPRCTTKATTTSSASNYKVAVIVQNYVNGTSWYRVWSDGWIEQGGVASGGANASGNQISLLKAYSNTNYTLVTGGISRQSDNFVNAAGLWVKLRALTTNSFNATSGYTSTYASYDFSWYACGY